MSLNMPGDQDDSDSEPPADELEASPLGKAQQYRAQNAAFSALWVKLDNFVKNTATDYGTNRLEQHVVDELNEDPNHEDGHDRPQKKGPQAELSVARLIADQGIGKGALDPREYQKELYERAKAENTIAVLDTGSGKTLVAVLLLKDILKSELLDRAEGAKPRIAFFLVNSVTLVFQQSAVLRNNLNQKVAHFYGDLGTDHWDKETWDRHLEKYSVIVCTAEILNQALLNGHVKMDQINLLIFDEAHHSKKDHPFAR